MKKAGGLAVIGVLVAIAVGGCAQPSPHVVPVAPPTVKPVFKSDAAALAAVRKAYVGYWAATDAVAHDGGSDPKRLSKWETSAAYKANLKSLALMRSEGHHTTGYSTFFGLRIQQSMTDKLRRARIVVYVCADITHTTLLNSAGRDIGEDRTLISPLEVWFTSGPKSRQALVVERSDLWSGQDFCS